MAFASCEGCHGSEGEGLDGLAPELLHPVVDYATWVVRNGREGHPAYSLPMPAFGSDKLSDEGLTEIFEWLNSAPQPTTGEGLYKDYCSNCHGDDGSGTTNHDATNVSLDEMIQNVRNGHHAGEFSRRTGFMPSWSADELSDAEINLIYNYVGTF
jgi:mono/diheme cytochrome c family protein